MPDQDYGVRFTAQDLTRKAAASAVKSIGGVVKSYVSMGLSVVGVTVATRKAIQVIRQSVQAANEQTVANAKVTQALKQTGQFTAATQQMLFDYATELQSATGIADDMTLSQQALALSMGAPAEALPRISQALADVSAAGLPAESILRGLVTAMTAGEAAMLSRYIPAVRNLTKEQLKQGAATEMLLEQFGGLAAAQAGTFSGSVEILTGAYGDMLEQIGFVITESPVAKAAIQELTKAINTQSGNIDENTGAYITLVDSGVLFLIDAMSPMIKLIGAAGTGMEVWQTVITAAITGFQTLAAAAVGAISLIFRGLAKIDEELGRKAPEDIAAMIAWSDRLIVSAKDSAKATEEMALGIGDSIAEAKESLVALEGHRQAIVDSAAAMRDQYGPSLEEANAGVRNLGEASASAAEDVKKLDKALKETKLTIDDMLDSIMELAIIEDIAASSVGAVAALRIGTDQAAQSLAEIIAQIEGVTAANQRMEQGLMSGADAWELWGERTKNVAFDVNNIVVNTLQRSIDDTFASMGDAAKASLGPIEDTGDAWKAAAGVVIDTLAEITASVVAAALAQGLANAVPIAGSAAATAGPAAPIVFAAVLATIGTAVAAAIGAAQSAESRIGAQEGGFVVGPGPRGVDSVPAALAPGEVVMPVDVVDTVRGILNGETQGGPGGVTMVNQWSSFIPPTRLQFAREYDRVAVDATRRLKALGRAV
jgi:hypothetical protein